MPAPRTKKRFANEAEVIDWIHSRRAGATVEVLHTDPSKWGTFWGIKERAGIHRFAYQTPFVKGVVLFAEGQGSLRSDTHLDLYQWKSGPPYYGGQVRSWEYDEVKDPGEEEEFDIEF